MGGKENRKKVCYSGMIPLDKLHHTSKLAIISCVKSRYNRCRLRRGVSRAIRLRTSVSRAIITAFTLLGVSTLVGCQQKDLLTPTETCKIDVRFLWDKAQGTAPEGMTLLFYPEKPDGEFWRFEISGRDGGPVEISPGQYTLIAINNDLPGVKLTDLPYSDASLTAIEAPHNRTYTSEVGMIYEGKVMNLKVQPDKVTYPSEEGNLLTSYQSIVDCYPDSLSTIYNFIFDDVEGLERIRSVEGTMEGCANGVLLSSLAPLATTVTTLFPLEINHQKNSITGTTSGFPNNTPSSKYGITLRLAYLAGGGYEKYFDITEQIKNSFYPHNVYIHISGLTLPEEPTIEPDEVGMKVDVDGWTVIEINLNSENL